MVNFLWENLFKKEKMEVERLRILSNTFIFEDLSPREIKFLRDVVHIRNYRPGESVFTQGELGVGMYIILKGHVDISVENSESSKDESSGIFVTRLGPGDFFGEISLVEDNGLRTASATASDTVSVIGFFKPDLNEVIARNPASGVKIMTRLAQVLGRRLQGTSDKVTDLKKELKKLAERK